MIGVFLLVYDSESCCSVRAGTKDALARGSCLAQGRLVSGSTDPLNALPEAHMMPTCLSLKPKAYAVSHI